MSETKLPKTDSTSNGDESASAKSNRQSGWISSNRWYLAGALLALLMARSEAKRAETPAMQRNRQAIEQMSRVERDRLRHNHAQFQKLSLKEVERVKAIHEAAQNDARMDETISQFHAWLATLSLSDRERLLATSNPEDRLQIIRRLMAELPQNDFKPVWETGSRTQFANFPRSQDDYQQMMQAAAEWVKLPASPEVDTPQGQLEHHTLVMAAIMDRILPGWRIAVTRAGSRPRPKFPDELRQVLLDQLSDQKMKRMIQGRPEIQQNMLAMSMLARGLFDETRRVAKTQRPTDAELDRVLQNLPEPRRKAIAEMPKEIGDRLLQQMWITRRLSPEAGESLSRLWTLFDKLLNRQPGMQRNGTSR